MKKTIAFLTSLCITTSISLLTKSENGGMAMEKTENKITAFANERVSVTPNPIISRNVPAYSGISQNPNYGNDEHYFSFWTSSAPDYLAYDLSDVPENQRKKVLAVWYNVSCYDNIGMYVNRNSEPIDYTIEVNSAEGGKYPEDGWIVAETVTDNGYCSRQHIVDMNGYNWIRINVSKADNNSVSFNFDVHDVSDGVSDSWIFFGDSITAGGMMNCYGTGYATYVNLIDSRYFPAQENAGIGGITSQDGRDNIDKWLSTCNARFVSIAYGTNDSWGNGISAETYYDNTKYMIDAILDAGKIPVLPKIPGSTNIDVAPYIPEHNAMIDKLYEEYGDKIIKGPDFENIMNEHPEYLSGDGVHPESAGYDAMRQIWAETMYKNVYSHDQLEEGIIGDTNGDGSFDVADLVTLGNWVIGKKDSVIKASNSDINLDGIIDAFDMAELRKKLTEL